MRRRLYRGVVKRACDDPGCDREWPCERHGAPIKYWQKQDHMHAACMKAGMTLEQAGAAVACSARDLDKRACAGCGYVVCACGEEEPKLLGVSCSEKPDQWKGVRYTPSEAERIYRERVERERKWFEEHTYVPSDAMAANTMAAMLREQRRQLQAAEAFEQNLVKLSQVAAQEPRPKATHIQTQPAALTLLERVRSYLADSLAAAADITYAFISAADPGEVVCGNKDCWVHRFAIADMVAFERLQQKPEPVTAEDVKLYLRDRTAEPVAVGQRYLGLEAWEVNYEDGTPFLSGLVADATVRAWKALRGK